jgi:hypothetical protein
MAILKLFVLLAALAFLSLGRNLQAVSATPVEEMDSAAF